MKVTAAVVEKLDGPFTVQELELDEPGPGEVLVRVAGTGLRHTDAITRHGDLPFPLPGVLGHEGAGTVAAVGPAVTDIRVGGRSHRLIGSLMTLYAAGRFPFDQLVEYLPLDRIEDAVEASHSGAVIKPVITMPYGAVPLPSARRGRAAGTEGGRRGGEQRDAGDEAPVQSDLREVASPFLHDIYGATLATVHLAVRDVTEALYLERLAGHVSVPVVSKVGARLPLHATGVGKVLLAHAPDDVVALALARLTAVTPCTVTQPGRMVRQLRQIRQYGFAQTVDEMTVGACSVAVPVRGGGDEVVAALGVLVADLRRERDRLVTALRVAAQGVGRSLRARHH